MIRPALLLMILTLLPGLALAQSRNVLPGELALEVTVEDTGYTPYVGEMVILTIRGTYRRHITRETLEQPALTGFNWTQLGQDHWFEERIRGQKVKVLERRMALFADRPGTLTIDPFVHHLTLTDEGDDWFPHEIRSAPLTLTILPAPAGQDWWFPVRGLRITDDWSNAPDRLNPGEGVLRVIRIEAVGATPEMIPPMPDLTSPSAMIFPHPEKRLVELSPQGPVTHAFWRWTIRPTNATSAILEPLTFSFFDTYAREHRTATITPQRVAYEAAAAPPERPVETARLPGWPVALVGALTFAAGVLGGLRGWQVQGMGALRRFAILDPLARGLKAAARRGDRHAMRRLAARMTARDGITPQKAALISQIDRLVYAPAPEQADLSALAQRFLSAGGQKNAADLS